MDSTTSHWPQTVCHFVFQNFYNLFSAKESVCSGWRESRVKERSPHDDDDDDGGGQSATSSSTASSKPLPRASCAVWRIRRTSEERAGWWTRHDLASQALMWEPAEEHVQEQRTVTSQMYIRLRVLILSVRVLKIYWKFFFLHLFFYCLAHPDSRNSLRNFTQSRELWAWATRPSASVPGTVFRSVYSCARCWLCLSAHFTKEEFKVFVRGTVV